MSANEILEGLQEAVEFARGERDARARNIKVPEHVDVRALRKSLKLTQEEFAHRFRFQVSAVRNWEQGRRMPTPSTVVLLKVIEKNPDIVAEAAEDIDSEGLLEA